MVKMYLPNQPVVTAPSVTAALQNWCTPEMIHQYVFYGCIFLDVYILLAQIQSETNCSKLTLETLEQGMKYVQS